MSQYFHFHDEDNDHYFNAKLESKRCSFIKANGMECKNRVCFGIPLCHVHVRMKYHVQIKKSTIPNAGNGLFAINSELPANAIIFKSGQKICPYEGQVINENVLYNRYGDKTAPYALELRKNEYEDGAIKRGIGCMINHANNTKANCRFSISNVGQRTCNIVATKNIRNGNELFVNYGKDYKFNENIETSTNRKKYNV